MRRKEKKEGIKEQYCERERKYERQEVKERKIKFKEERERERERLIKREKRDR